jgi:hypothetical protein
MATSRRNFLKTGSVMALAAGVPLSLADKVAGKTISHPAEHATAHLSKAAFAAQLNTTFELATKPSNTKVSLTKITDIPVKGGVVNKNREGFSLLFRANEPLRLTQDTYVINHRKLGTFSLLLVPTRTDDHSVSHYEAVINRLYP